MSSRVEAPLRIENGFVVRLRSTKPMPPFEVKDFDRHVISMIGRTNFSRESEYHFLYVVRGDTMVVAPFNRVDHKQLDLTYRDRKITSGLLQSAGQIDFRYSKFIIRRLHGWSQTLNPPLTVAASDEYRKTVMETELGANFTYNYNTTL